MILGCCLVDICMYSSLILKNSGVVLCNVLSGLELCGLIDNNLFLLLVN